MILNHLFFFLKQILNRKELCGCGTILRDVFETSSSEAKLKIGLIWRDSTMFYLMPAPYINIQVLPKEY